MAKKKDFLDAAMGDMDRSGAEGLVAPKDKESAPIEPKSGTEIQQEEAAPSPEPVTGKNAAQIKSEWDAKSPKEKGELGHIIPPVGDAPAPTGVEPPTKTYSDSLAAIFEALNPKPKERTPEEQAKYERQRRASGVVMGISDALNGLFNLGATLAGAPPQSPTPMAGKWLETLDAAEKQRRERLDSWRAEHHKYALEDYKYNRQREAERDAEKRKADEFDRQSKVQHENQKELLDYKAGLDESARDHAAEIAAEQEQTKHDNTIKEIEARGKASSSAGKDSSAPDSKPRKETFVATINDTPVDVGLRSAEDVHTLYSILAEEVKSNSSKGSSELKELEELVKALSGETVDSSIAATKKKDFIRNHFAEYYPKIKNKPQFKHLDVEFRNNKGELITFVDSPASPQTYGDVEAQLRGSSTPDGGLLNQNLGDRSTTSNNNEVITLSFVNR